MPSASPSEGAPLWGLLMTWILAFFLFHVLYPLCFGFSSSGCAATLHAEPVSSHISDVHLTARSWGISPSFHVLE